MIKPYSEACDRNCEPILAVIRPLLRECEAVLEIGSGTGQHAVYFAKQLPHLVWHTSDREEQHEGIRLWLKQADLANTRLPLPLNVMQDVWPALAVDAVFSANTTHIMHWPEVEALFQGVGRLLPARGLFLLYGPFNYAGCYTSASNAHFDEWLHARDPHSGIRNFEEIDALARTAGMNLLHDAEMPANNRMLVWEKQ